VRRIVPIINKIISLNGINRFVVVVETPCVSCEVGTGFVIITRSLRGVHEWKYTGWPGHARVCQHVYCGTAGWILMTFRCGRYATGNSF
jgi:hypothetical protein